MADMSAQHAMLVEMGFAADAALYALRQTGGSNMDDVLQFLQDVNWPAPLSAFLP